MKLFDTLTKSYKELNQPQINIYTCGPTIYDEIHIGNTRPILLSDTLIRFLEWKQVNINFLQNITDVDDKIIKKAIQENKTELEIAQVYEKAYLDNLSKLNIRMPNRIISISSEIKLMQNFINDLISKKAAYIFEGNVYFDTHKYLKEYGKLSNIKAAKLNVGNRIEISENKRKSNDFSLWKRTNTGIQWEFHNYNGRPGWHTECVALIDKYFKGETIDIHIGGIDLQFPHHENERIQFIAKHEKELSRIWMHNGHLTINDVKMSKSLQNVTTLKDFLKKFNANCLRWIFLTTHYKKPINISDDFIDQGTKFNKKIKNIIKKMKQIVILYENLIDIESPNSDYEKITKINYKTKDSLYKVKKNSFNSQNCIPNFIFEFKNCMQNDLNTPMVLSLIDEIILTLNKLQNKLVYDLNVWNKKNVKLADLSNYYNSKIVFKNDSSIHKNEELTLINDNFIDNVKIYNTLFLILEVLGFEFKKSLKVYKKTKLRFLLYSKLVANKEFEQADEIRVELIKKGFM